MVQDVQLQNFKYFNPSYSKIIYRNSFVGNLSSRIMSKHNSMKENCDMVAVTDVLFYFTKFATATLNELKHKITVLI